jgi:uncharacterized Zn-binding protein involved in type VI secretion
MIRRVLCVGDEPATGGEVLPYESASCLRKGHQIAVIGGKAKCNACKSTGVIARKGGNRRATFYDWQVALDGEILLCKCKKPPLMVAKLAGEDWYDDLSKDIPIPELNFDEKVRILDKKTGDAIQFLPYLLLHSESKNVLAAGITDENGFTERVHCEAADKIEIHIRSIQDEL